MQCSTIWALQFNLLTPERLPMNLKKLMHTDAGWGMTALRIVTGIVFMGHGAPKWGLKGEGTFDGTVEFIASIGFPVPAVGAFLVASFELVGGA